MRESLPTGPEIGINPRSNRGGLQPPSGASLASESSLGLGATVHPDSSRGVPSGPKDPSDINPTYAEGQVYPTTHTKTRQDSFSGARGLISEASASQGAFLPSRGERVYGSGRIVDIESLTHELDGTFRYQEIASDILRRIVEGDFLNGVITAISNLCDEYNVTADTMRKALHMLKGIGIITREQETSPYIANTVFISTDLSARERPNREAPLATRNFEKWKDSVWFPNTFPELGTLSDQELLSPDGKFILDLEQMHVMGGVIDSASESGRSFIVVPEGQGATTLARYLTLRLRNLHIGVGKFIVDVSPESFFAGRASGEDLPTVIEKALVVRTARQFMKSPTLQNYFTASRAKEDREKLRGLLGVGRSGDFSLRPADDVNWDAIGKIAPSLLNDSYEEIWHGVKSIKPKLHIALVVDLSGLTRLGQNKSIASEIVETIEAMTDPWVFRTFYFVNKEPTQQLRAGREVLQFPPHEQANAFAIIRQHNPRSVQKGWEFFNLPMTGVVSPRLLSDIQEQAEREGREFHNLRLDEIVTLLQERFLEEMDRPWSQVPFLF